ncbi:Aquaporin-9 [Smittium mucronatum]|uniref:Aquaporin-9 n=1 Tax=Smittium mucronatum TaxID=133383 RepID=A0A1R0GST0_9FUNG|nr:Aquaporin-9 [Smittium mucronatum]
MSGLTSVVGIKPSSDDNLGTELSNNSLDVNTLLARKHRFPYFFKYRYEFREYLAELIGTTIFMTLGICVNSTVFFDSALSPEYMLIIALGWGFAVVVSLYAISGTGGGHLNPAMSISLAVFGLFPWKKVPGFIACQFLGCFFGSAIGYSVYVKKYNAFDGGSRQTTGPHATAGIFSSYPDPIDVTWNAFYIEFAFTFIMNFIIQGVLENRTYPSKGIEPLILGLMITAIILAGGVTKSINANPARDLAPRIFTALFGWGSEPFTENRHYFWVPVVAPILGAIGGVGAYELLLFPTDEYGVEVVKAEAESNSG